VQVRIVRCGSTLIEGETVIGSRLSSIIRPALRLVPVAAVLLLGACMPPSRPVEDYSRYDFIRNDLSPEVAQLLMQEYTATACGYFDQGVAKVAESQSNAEIAENVERFREAGLTAIRRAGWRLQPVGAAFDSVILFDQMVLYLESDEAKTAFGPARDDLITVVRRIEPLAEDVMEKIAVDPGSTREELVSTWVREHPLEGLELARMSPLLGVADQTDRLDDPLRKIARVQFSAAAAYGRNDALLALPADVRRQLESAVRGVMREPLIVNALVGLARLGDGMKETGRALAAIDDHLDDHRDAILADLDRQRIVTIEAVAAERAVILEAIAAERAMILEAVAAERQAVLAEVDRQTDKVMDRTEKLVSTSIDEAVDGVGDAIGRTATGLGVSLVAVVMLLMFATHVVRRRTSA
jgi:hypothetical protein